MRIGGLATGMDIDQLVEKLMSAERMPLDRMEQDRTKLTWKRDAFRDVNKSLLELDSMMFDMKRSKTYNSKSASSSNESAVTATASTSSGNGSYKIKVEKLATSAVNIGGEMGDDVSGEKIDLDTLVSEIEGYQSSKSIQFSTYDKNGKPNEPHSIEIEDGDTIKDVLSRITKEDNNVRAFYDEQEERVIMETTRTGKYNNDVDGIEIELDSGDNSFFTEVLKMTGLETGGTDAEFTYNGQPGFTSKSNSYELNGVNFEFKDEGSANLTVTNDDESTYESIMDFVDKYNEVIDTLNGTQQEEKNRDFPPLTDEQKEDMSEKEIELWEEKAKSGILRGESAISGGMFSMRQGWYSNVTTGGEFTSLTQIGITTSQKYLDGGTLEVNSDKLKAALRENPDDVMKLFSSNTEGAERGLVNRLEDAVESTMGKIEQRAGKGTNSLETYTLGKQMKNLNTRISAFEDRLTQVETRYWNQFTQMEKAIQRMNAQSEQLMSQLGGGGMM